MFNSIDLRSLAELSGPERAFLSLYLSGVAALPALGQRTRKVRAMLAESPVEQEYFDENMKLVQRYLDEHPITSEGLCIFACWANDFLKVYPLEKQTRDLLWVDSSPYIRLLAELQDEYENFVVIAASNADTRIYLVTSAVPDEEARVKGDIKNQVKVGGWSQKRYARRREKDLHHYAKEISNALADLEARQPFDRVLIVGSKETIEEVKRVLPESMAKKVVGEKNVDLRQGDQVWDEAFGLYFEEERDSEQVLWEQIKSEYLRGGRAAAGPEDVLSAAAAGRVEKLIVLRDAEIPGIRCRACESLSAGVPERCPACGSDDLFKEDLVNELVELLALSGAEAEFADPITGLHEVGDVAALLRY